MSKTNQFPHLMRDPEVESTISSKTHKLTGTQAVSTHPSSKLRLNFPLSNLREGMLHRKVEPGRVEKPSINPTSFLRRQESPPTEDETEITKTNLEIPDIRYATSGMTIKNKKNVPGPDPAWADRP